MIVAYRRAQLLGVAAIAGIVALQAFNSVACYDHDLSTFLGAVGVLLVAPLLPALLSLRTANPLRAVGACLLLAPWLVFAYYTDCVRPYAGGGASLVYVAVLLWGTPSAVVGALVAGPVLRAFGVTVAARTGP